MEGHVDLHSLTLDGTFHPALLFRDVLAASYSYRWPTASPEVKDCSTIVAESSSPLSIHSRGLQLTTACSCLADVRCGPSS